MGEINMKDGTHSGGDKPFTVQEIKASAEQHREAEGRWPEAAQAKAEPLTVKGIKAFVEQYRLEHGRFPSTGDKGE